ncbi:uncharacterized protein LOC134844108 [Symsagittifera roscoffensis]|uniref:uncharacterized protein LOC134844108 n=1 Tax=Symsagittifera roscoffensis TaxID=84072 RepID=UPI00307B221F
MRLFRLVHMAYIYMWDYSGPIFIPLLIMAVMIMLFKWYDRKYLSKYNEVNEEVVQFINVEQFKKQRDCEYREDDLASKGNETDSIESKSVETLPENDLIDSNSAVEKKVVPNGNAPFCPEGLTTYYSSTVSIGVNYEKRALGSGIEKEAIVCEIQSNSNCCKESLTQPETLLEKDSNLTTNLDFEDIHIKHSPEISNLMLPNQKSQYGLLNNNSEFTMDLAKHAEKANGICIEENEICEEQGKAKLGQENENSDAEEIEKDEDSDASSSDTCSDDEIISYDLEAENEESGDTKPASYTINLSSNIIDSNASDSSANVTPRRSLTTETALKSCLRESSTSFHADGDATELTPSRVKFGEIKVNEVDGLGACSGDNLPSLFSPRITSFDDSSSDGDEYC